LANFGENGLRQLSGLLQLAVIIGPAQSKQ
jgi:hypothetical protein